MSTRRLDWLREQVEWAASLLDDGAPAAAEHVLRDALAKLDRTETVASSPKRGQR